MRRPSFLTTSTPINPGDNVADSSNRVDLTVTEGTGVQALEALMNDGGVCASAACKIGFSVSDGLDGSSSGEVLLEPWTAPVPNELVGGGGGR